MTSKTASTPDSTGRQLNLEIKNIGGVSHAQFSLSSGVTLFSGENASNKSSTLRALAGVLGGPLPPLKSDADTGSVRMNVGDDEYYLDLTREDGDVVVSESRVYSGKDGLCELFMALTEINPIRQAVLAGDDLSELLMQPIDTDEIEAEIRRLAEEKESLDDRLDDLDKMKNRIPGLQARRDSIQQEIEAVSDSLEETRTEIEEFESEIDQTGEDTAAIRPKRNKRREIKRRIRKNESAVESLTKQLERTEEKLDSIEVTENRVDIDELAEEIERLHHQKQQLTSTVNTLSPIAEMNSQMLNEEDDVPAAMKSDDIVSELDPASQSVTCWTCGSSVEQAQIADQVETVQEIMCEKRSERDALTERIQKKTTKKQELESERTEREDLRKQRADVSTEIETRRETLSELRQQRRTLEDEISELQEQHGKETDREARLSELYDEVSDLEYERGQLSNDLERVEEEISEIKTALSTRETVENDRESVAEELREQRERIDQIEQELVTTFNEMMQRVLDTLKYNAIERIWIERRSSGTRISAESEFELHLVRTTDEGRAYNDTVDSLSKSEREVIGLVVALAGYLVHDVGEHIPFVIVDAIEMFDADRIQGLLEHFNQHAEFVITAVLPEEQNELDGLYDSISTAAIGAD